MLNALTADTRAYIGIASRLPQGYAPEFHDYVRFRAEIERLSVRQAPYRYNVVLKRYDPALRVRWDYLQHDTLIIERFSKETGTWLFICPWPRAREEHPASAEEVVAYLQEHDMQRFRTPADYIAHKRAKAATIRKSRDNDFTDAMLAAVDGMSTARMLNFLKVEQALRTGDRITFHGDDYKKIERMIQASRKAIAAEYNSGGQP